jgi:hypothetical protein
MGSEGNAFSKGGPGRCFVSRGEVGGVSLKGLKNFGHPCITVYGAICAIYHPSWMIKQHLKASRGYSGQVLVIVLFSNVGMT